MIYWVFLSILYLVKLTWHDLKNNMLVDDRYNYFMSGVTISLISHYSNPIWYYLILIVINIALGFFINKFKLMGEADTNSVMWLFFGFGVINPILVGVYFGLLMAFLAFQAGVFVVLRHFFKANKKRKHFPAYPAFLIAFILTIWLWGGLF